VLTWTTEKLFYLTEKPEKNNPMTGVCHTLKGQATCEIDVQPRTERENRDDQGELSCFNPTKRGGLIQSLAGRGGGLPGAMPAICSLLFRSAGKKDSGEARKL